MLPYLQLKNVSKKAENPTSAISELYGHNFASELPLWASYLPLHDSGNGVAYLLCQ